MKRNTLFILIATFYILPTVLLGCATVKEIGKGFAGVSTKVLEDKRKDALKKSFLLDYPSCYAKVKEALKEDKKALKEGEGIYIYSEDSQKKMIALYLSETDTTPVGIFFTEEAKNKTLIEVSSPSTYAKELVAKNIFTVIDAMLKPKTEPAGQSEENRTNVK